MEKAPNNCNDISTSHLEFKAEAKELVNDVGCHGFFICIDGEAYSCQAQTGPPKIRGFT